MHMLTLDCYLYLGYITDTLPINYAFAPSPFIRSCILLTTSRQASAKKFLLHSAVALIDKPPICRQYRCATQMLHRAMQIGSDGGHRTLPPLPPLRLSRPLFRPLPLPPGAQPHLPWGYFIAFSLLSQQGMTFGWLNQKIDQIANWALSIYGNCKRKLIKKIYPKNHFYTIRFYPIYVVLRSTTQHPNIYVDARILHTSTQMLGFYVALRSTTQIPLSTQENLFC